MRIKIPALRAALIQFTVFLVVTGLSQLLTLSGFPSPLGANQVLLQGLLASMLSQKMGLAPWWIAIQFIFPVAALIVPTLHLPPVFFLCGFLVLLTVYWTTFKTQVPFYPSNATVWAAVLDLLPKERAVRFIDIGSGMGGLLRFVGMHRPADHLTGVEIAPLPWIISLIRSRLARQSCRILRKNYHTENLADYDVVFAYLSPAAMPSLWAKAAKEMSPGSLLLSYEFPVEGIEPDTTLCLPHGMPSLYLWRIEARSCFVD